MSNLRETAGIRRKVLNFRWQTREVVKLKLSALWQIPRGLGDEEWLFQRAIREFRELP
jgi:hypothetical protein